MLFPTVDKIEVRQVRLYVQYKISYGSREVYKQNTSALIGLGEAANGGFL